MADSPSCTDIPAPDGLAAVSTLLLNHIPVGQPLYAFLFARMDSNHNPTWVQWMLQPAVLVQDWPPGVEADPPLRRLARVLSWAGRPLLLPRPAVTPWRAQDASRRNYSLANSATVAKTRPLFRLPLAVIGSLAEYSSGPLRLAVDRQWGRLERRL